MRFVDSVRPLLVAPAAAVIVYALSEMFVQKSGRMGVSFVIVLAWIWALSLVAAVVRTPGLCVCVTSARTALLVRRAVGRAGRRPHLSAGAWARSVHACFAWRSSWFGPLGRSSRPPLSSAGPPAFGLDTFVGMGGSGRPSVVQGLSRRLAQRLRRPHRYVCPDLDLRRHAPARGIAKAAVKLAAASAATFDCVRGIRGL